MARNKSLCRQNDWHKKTLDDLPLEMESRDVTWQEEWPDVEGPKLSPDHVSEQFFKLGITVNIIIA